jgi:hypothetical protein
MRTSAVVALSIALSMRAAFAQATPVSAQHADDCRAAGQTLSTGDPASKVEWALQAIRGCGDQGTMGTSIAAAITRLRFSADTAQLMALRTATFGFVDGAVYAAALEVAADGSASPPARAVDLLIAITQLDRDVYVSYQDLRTVSDTVGCQLGITYDVPKLVGLTPLPAHADVLASNLANKILSDRSAPQLVRAAATCLAQATTK